MILNNEELMNIKGGSISFKVAGLITGIVASIITFAVGIWDGFKNPNKCK